MFMGRPQIRLKSSLTTKQTKDQGFQRSTVRKAEIAGKTETFKTNMNFFVFILRKRILKLYVN